MQKAIPEGPTQILDHDAEIKEVALALRSYQKTFRVRGIPYTCNRSDTADILKAVLGLQEDWPNLKVRSLALNPYRQFHEKVATVSFASVPSALNSGTGKDQWQFSLPGFDDHQLPYENGEDAPPREAGLVIDTHFRGFTALRSFHNSADCKVDCIGISGLGGHSFGSFKERGGSHMWLRDSLPQDLPGARILIYGYDTRLEGSQSFQDVRTLAGQFRNQIKAIRGQLTNGQPPKPLLFIAHSLGGLIMKQALIQMRVGDDLDKANLKATYGALFFGVPSRGMDISSLVPMVGNQPNRQFLDSLDKESAILQEQRTKFPEVFDFKDSEIISFFETQKSPTAKREGGKWSMTGEPTVLVDIVSATHSRPWELEDRYILAINRNHSDLVKFSKQDEDYEVVLHHLRRFAGLAPKVVGDRFKGNNDNNFPAIAPILMEEAQVQTPVELTREQQSCLHSLAFPEINHREYDITPQANKTCLWLLKHKVFLEWLGQSHEILWLKGKPGAGKSTLLKNAFRETKKNELSQNKLVVASHFFHGRGSQIQKVPLGLFRSLLHQLLEKIPNVLSELTEKFQTKVKTQGDPGSRWNWHPMELQELLTTSLLKAGRSYKLKIFVDALDECGEEAAIELVRYFQRVVTASRQAGGSLSICFSCRHYPIISLDGAFEICVEDENKIDIESYIQNELQSIRDQTKISILQEQITARASGSFQWVTLVVPRICQLHRKGKPLRVIRSHIEKIPAELNNLYRQLLESIEEESVSQSLHIMQWICFATRPLTLDELRHAIAVDADTPYKSLKECRSSPEYADTLEEMEFRLKDLCRGLAETKEHKNGRVVQFIHQSVNDFLIQEGLKMLEHSSESADQVIGRAHLRLSRSCIRYIDMEEIGLWVHHIKSEAPQIFYHLKPYIPPELLLIEYASTQLFLHAKTSETKGVLQSDLHIFFQWPSNKTVQRWNFIYNIFLPYHSASSLKGATLLHIASFYGLISVVEAILKTGADVDSKDSKYGRTPLLFAAEEGHDVVVELLLKRAADVNSKDKYGITPLSYAARGGHVAVLELLLEKGAHVDHEDNYDTTPLSYAARRGHVAVLELLLEKEANVYHEDNYGTTPLSYAAERGHVAILGLLLRKGANVDHEDEHGRTPLSYAAERGHVAILGLLLEKGADVDHEDNHGRTPFSYAAVGGHVAFLELLLEKGANVDREDEHSRTPLSFAAEFGEEAAIKFLLEKAVKVNSRDCNGRTPLSYASERGCAGVVMLLLEKGANVDDVDKSGNTPLSLAVVHRSGSRGHVAVVKLLLESGRLKEKTISAALSLAKENSFEEGVELLEEWIATHKAEA